MFINIFLKFLYYFKKLKSEFLIEIVFWDFIYIIYEYEYFSFFFVGF